jgi:hypothetical protein
MFIKDNSAWINIEIACEIFAFSRSAYYEWLARFEQNAIKLQQDKQLATDVVKAFNESRCTYGVEYVL